MIKWSKVIEDNWDAITDAMQKASRNAGSYDNDSRLVITVDKSGTIETVCTFDGVLTPEERNGDAIAVRKYYGGECWSEDWAGEYDAAVDLDHILQEMHNAEELAEYYGNENA